MECEREGTRRGGRGACELKGTFLTRTGYRSSEGYERARRDFSDRGCGGSGCWGELDPGRRGATRAEVSKAERGEEDG